MASRALFNVAAMAALIVAFHFLFSWAARDEPCLYWFLVLFTWRYLRFLINLAAFWCYSPAPKPTGIPTYTPSRDVTVIIPTVDPQGKGFKGCLTTCAQNKPAKIVIVTAGDELYVQTLHHVVQVERHFPSTKFVVDRTQVANKREQVALAVAHVETDITALLDDSSYWGPRYLEAILCPFEDPTVGLVGTNKLVQRKHGLNLWGRIWNMLGATYLLRHNFEIRATNTVDGGVFVVSGRTCAIRTAILRHPDFLPRYTNERFFFGLFGPLNPDDDNYNTRFVVKHGWKIKIQYTDDAEMRTTMGVDHPIPAKFLSQCRRWARTTWRSNLCSLITDRTVWASQPYCVYAVYLTSLTNFAAITDPLLIYLFTHTRTYSSYPGSLAGLVSWILFTKATKVFAYFHRYPQDICLFPAYVAFAYFHSFIKLWALLTFWDCNWSGRCLDQVKVKTTTTTTTTTSTTTSTPDSDSVADSDAATDVSEQPPELRPLIPRSPPTIE
ncbi:hypothetical protein VTK26DRAFT_2597 [Humicola hyalothermophila]